MKEFVKKILSILPLRNVIVFSSLNDFDCNSGALFRYLLEHQFDKKYIFVWSTIRKDSGEEFKDIRNVKIFHESSRSLLKRYYFYVAKFFIWDNHPLTKKRKDQLSIYTTHGVPALKSTAGKIFVDSAADYALCPAEGIKEWVSREFNVNIDKLFICDQPRNDYLFMAPRGYLNDLKTSIPNYKKTVLWMPTFRTRQNGENDSQASFYLGLPLIQDRKNLEDLNTYLTDKGILLIIKLHPQQLIQNEKITDFQNIYFMRDNKLNGKSFDINEIMVETDALMTDYSSVLWDYLLLNKPLGFTIPDIEDYSLGFAVKDPLNYMPGNHIYTTDELYSFFDQLLDEKDLYIEERKKVCDLVHKYKDGNNCKRLLEKFGII